MSHDLHPQRRPVPGARGRAPLNPVLAILLACGAVVVLFVAGAMAERYSSKEPAAATPVTGPPTKAAPAGPTSRPPPGVGAAGRDGKVGFVGSRVGCPRPSVGPERLQPTPHGQN